MPELKELPGEDAADWNPPLLPLSEPEEGEEDPPGLCTKEVPAEPSVTLRGVLRRAGTCCGIVCPVPVPVPCCC